MWLKFVRFTLAIALLVGGTTSGAATSARLHRPTALAGATRSVLWTVTASRSATTGDDIVVRGKDHVYVSSPGSLLPDALATAPQEGSRAARRAATVIDLPTPSGRYARFRVVKTAVMAPALAAKLPSITTYSAVGVDDTAATAHLDLGPLGFHAQVFSPHGVWDIDPVRAKGSAIHVSYFRNDLVNQGDFIEHGVRILSAPATSTAPSRQMFVAARTSGAQRTVYRFAVAADGEYTQFFGGTVAGALAAIVTTVNRVNQIYQQEVSAQLQLVPNNDLLVYTDPNSDPYTDSDPGALLDQNQANIDAVIGSANYDLGHVFTTGGGGLAGLGVLGDPSFKAHGVTGSSSPVGDAYDVDYVAHELGHQFNANHTFNDNTNGACAGNRNASTAVEPGSGITIMAYAGICTGDNLAEHSVPYFSTVSYEEIRGHMEAKSTVGVKVSTGNAVPSITPADGPTFTIPPLTPFVLTAAGVDSDGPALTYTWEQTDLGPVALIGAQPPSGPLFWFVPPSSSPSRYFPALLSIAANDTNAATGSCGSFTCKLEILPSTARTMHFTGTVRDGANGVANTTVTVNVSGTERFRITSPNAAGSIANQSDLTVTWAVAGTDSGAVNTPTVDILLSEDGGRTFPKVLASNVANNGSATVSIRSVDGASASIMVRGHGNIFFDTTDAYLTVTPAIADFPTSPRLVRGTAGAGRVTVEWDPPLDDGGSPITRYVVLASSGGRRCSTTGAHSCVVTGLTPGTPYTFTVRAANVIGFGSLSSASAPVTPFGRPGAPLNVTVERRNDALLVAWSAPTSDGGLPIVRYVATASPGGAVCGSSTGTSCAIRGLSDTTAYTVTVKAKNAAGYGVDSPPSDPVTPQSQ
ncbi:MAG: M12 family metallo-peptidase [Methylotetracoccus sp.]